MFSTFLRMVKLYLGQGPYDDDDDDGDDGDDNESNIICKC